MNKILLKPTLIALTLALAAVAIPAHAGNRAVRHYTITFHATSGTFTGQSYTGSFGVDESGLIGVGTETLPPTTVSDLQVQIFGNQSGPFQQALTPVFVDGQLVKVLGGFGARSATEGNQVRSIGINNGFGEGQIPGDLQGGRWWGYLDPGTFVDGFGPYDLTLQPLIPTQYTIQAQATSGTFAGQTYSGSFELDPTGVSGFGNEHVGSGAIRAFRLNIFGNEVGPLNSGIEADLVDGRVVRIQTVFAAKSATEGNAFRSVGFNLGFGEGQIPANLAGQNWFGYLNPATYVDGYGPYTIAPAPVIRHYGVTFTATSGTFNGAKYYGTFSVDVSGLRGIGTETLPNTTVDDLQVTMFGNQVGPFANAAVPVFVDGRLVKILSGFGAPSATEGNRIRSVGINNGFGEGQIPAELRGGRWWGYLNPSTFVDGYGPYELSEQFDINIYTAVEIEFSTRLGRTYQIQVKTDLGLPPNQGWVNLGAPVPGTAGSVIQFVSVKGTSRGNFRVVESGP
jgi:hypothetical protein